MVPPRLTGMRPIELPEELAGVAFTSDRARALGVPSKALRTSRLEHPTRGVWAQHPVGDDLRERARAAHLAMCGDAAFSHVTGARLLVLPLPPRALQQRRLDVCTRTDVGQRRRDGWVGRRGLETRQVVVVDGLRVVDLVDTWIDLAALTVGRHPTMTRVDLVVVGDEVLNRLLCFANAAQLTPRRKPYLDAALVAAAYREIDAAIARRIRPRGKRNLLWARERIRPGVRSPKETEARLVVVEAGLPEPLINHDITAPDGSGWLGEGDLVWRARDGWVVVEYQGAHHADRRQASADELRQRILEDNGCAVFPMWAEDLDPGARQRAFLARVAAALTRQGGPTPPQVE